MVTTSDVLTLIETLFRPLALYGGSLLAPLCNYFKLTEMVDAAALFITRLLPGAAHDSHSTLKYSGTSGCVAKYFATQPLGEVRELVST